MSELQKAVLSCNRTFTPIRQLFEHCYAPNSLDNPIHLDVYELKKLLRRVERGWHVDCERVHTKLLAEAEEDDEQDEAEEADEDEDLPDTEAAQSED